MCTHFCNIGYVPLGRELQRTNVQQRVSEWANYSMNTRSTSNFFRSYCYLVKPCKSHLSRSVKFFWARNRAKGRTGADCAVTEQTLMISKMLNQFSRRKFLGAVGATTLLSSTRGFGAHVSSLNNSSSDGVPASGGK